VTAIAGQAGDFIVSLEQSPRYVDMDKCIACGICAEKCPAKAIDEFNEGLSQRKAAYIPYPQAVPLVYAIDPARCIYVQKGKCRACEKFCPAEAIKLDEEARSLQVNVGAVIMAPGSSAFDPSAYDQYNYAHHPNVVTAMEFERILAATGPWLGHLVRPGDEKPPSKIAWLQCVGSRDLQSCDHAYCSSVCCMYAIKEALIAKEHAEGELGAAVFYMDMRTFGKDFEKYYNRAKEEGVRFIRSRIHSIDPAPEGNLRLRYVTEEGSPIEEDFDLVVLSVGLETSGEVIELAERLGVEVNENNFAASEVFAPVATSRPGVFACGAFAGPKDIPVSVTEASAAAAAAAAVLAPARGSLARVKEFPPERDVRGEEPRVGVFVCRCGTNIAGFADVEAIAAYARSLPQVAYVEDNLFTCSQDTQEKMAEVIKEQGINRVVVAACTPKTHEPLFQETIRNAGLNEHLFEMANIRNQCTWVHSTDQEGATDKAKDLVRMAVARVSLLEPIPQLTVEVQPSALVVGGGVAGMAAALSLADQGFPVTIVEKSESLGGAARELSRTWQGQDVGEQLKGMVNRVEEHSQIEVLFNSEVEESGGYVGNFETRILVGGEAKTVRHGVGVIATGAEAVETDEYLYGRSERVTRWHDLEKAPEKLKNAKTVVMIQCVGSRDEARPYCSRICCTASVSQALRLKEEDPGLNVIILYRDMRTFGQREVLYSRARRAGVVFIRYSLDRKPVVTEKDDGLEVRVFDPILGREVLIRADLVNLATAIAPVGHESLASCFKLPTDEDGFFMEAHAKLRPVDFTTDGLFVCGLAHYPKPLEESIAQAQAAASRAATVLSRSAVEISPLVSQVDEEKCIGCGLCIEICPFGAIVEQEMAEGGLRAETITASCKGCGLCAASCPQKAIDMLHFKEEQIVSSLRAAMS